MFSIIALALITEVFGQSRTCEYQGGPNERYLLNLTSISGYRLEYKSNNFNYVKFLHIHPKIYIQIYTSNENGISLNEI